MVIKETVREGYSIYLNTPCLTPCILSEWAPDSRSLFSEISIEISSLLPLCGNNQGALFIAQNPVQEC